MCSPRRSDLPRCSEDHGGTPGTAVPNAREQDPRPTLLRAGRAHYARVARTRGGGCSLPGNPSSSGWLRRGTHQLGCAWWRHHVTSLLSPPLPSWAFQGRPASPPSRRPRLPTPAPHVPHPRGEVLREWPGFRRSSPQRGEEGRQASCSRSARSVLRQGQA